MRILFSLALVLLLQVHSQTVALAQNLSDSVLERISTGIVRVIANGANDKLRVGTGFLWSSPEFIVTSLHVVAGDEEILIEYPLGDGLVERRTARISKVLLSADLALLKIEEPLSRTSIPADSDDGRDTIWVSGFPLEQKISWTRSLKRTEGGTQRLRNMLTENQQKTVATLGFPSLDQPVIRVQGPLHPGDSGAPIVNSAGKVIGIGEGGLRSGTSSLGWIIPAGELDKLLQSADDIPPYSNDIITKLAGAYSFSSAAPVRSTSNPKKIYRSGFELPTSQPETIRDFVSVEPNFAPCLALSSSFTEWRRTLDPQSGRYALSVNPEGNPKTKQTQTNYCRSSTLVVSAAELDRTFDTSGSPALRVSYFRKSTSNPRTDAVHNCDSSFNIYVSRDGTDWEHFSAFCGQEKSESKGWQEMRFDIPAKGAQEIRLGFTYDLQNSTVEDPDAQYLIDDLRIVVAE